MKRTGANLLVYALEQLGIRYTFGIPGVHNTEIYDELNSSEKITPILVTHEGCGAFMADAVSRTSNSIGTLVIVPAAGTTHALSGIGEAFLDGIPMLIISGGTRRDTGKSYQLHEFDQQKILLGIVKKYTLIERHDQIIPTIYEAYRIATSGEPGPVFVEIPVEIQLFSGEIQQLPPFIPLQENEIDAQTGSLEQAIELLTQAKHPGIYLGWGAVDAVDLTQELANKLVAPVATTLQGLSAFPASHPLHTGVGFGKSAVPAGQKAFKQCDCLLAVGVRFGELATGSYGMDVPENLIHIDINPEVFHKNYPAKVTIEGDSRKVLVKLLNALNGSQWESPLILDDLSGEIAQLKSSYSKEWTRKKTEKHVSPGFFFESLRKKVPDDTFVITDDGKHTFLTAELFPNYLPRHFISPTDFNCMGYGVPASIATKLANRAKTVVGIVGDGAFLMTGLELLTAATYGLGVIIFVFNDGELGQISQFQKVPLNRKTCTTLGKLRIEGIATATGVHFLPLKNDYEIEKVIDDALHFAEAGHPVLVDVQIDYSKKTNLTKGVIKTNLGRFPFSEKVRFLSRALRRHITG